MANDMPSELPASTPDITRFLAGYTRAVGVFEDRRGRPRRRFLAHLNGRWVDKEFVLSEDFTYDDGSTEHRVWKIQASGGGRFTATCTDCQGIATGRHTQDGWHMSYFFRLPVGRRRLTVWFVDRVYVTGTRTAINRSTVSRFGIHLGDALIAFEKPANEDPHHLPSELAASA